MSERVINDPESAGWEFDPDTGYWMWKGEEGTGGLWEQNGDDIYYNDGNVGIGTDNPPLPLTVERGDIGTTGNYRIKDSGGTYRPVMSLTSDDLIIKTGTNAGTRGIAFETENIERMRIDANGRVDITSSLYVNGSEVGSGGGGLPDGDYTHNGKITATDFISTSDERLKDNITPMPIGLIDDIKPVSWDWKDGSGTSAGVVAQQLQAVGLGDYVHENEDGQLGVNYQALTAILLAEVIELKRSLK